MPVLAQADGTHIEDISVDVARVEHVLGIGSEHAVACLACVQVRVVAVECVLEVLGSIALEGVIVQATFGALVQ